MKIFIVKDRDDLNTGNSLSKTHWAWKQLDFKYFIFSQALLVYGNWFCSKNVQTFSSRSLLSELSCLSTLFCLWCKISIYIWQGKRSSLLVWMRYDQKYIFRLIFYIHLVHIGQLSNFGYFEFFQLVQSPLRLQDQNGNDI